MFVLFYAHLYGAFYKLIDSYLIRHKMDDRIKVQVNKMVVHKRIHEYLKAHTPRAPTKVETNEQESSNSHPPPSVNARKEEGKLKAENPNQD